MVGGEAGGGRAELSLQGWMDGWEPGRGRGTFRLEVIAEKVGARQRSCEDGVS